MTATLTASMSGDALTEMGDATPRRQELAWPKLGRYQLRERLASGATGIVFEALDPSLDRAVAVKVLHAGTSETSVGRMQREAHALARLSHPNVVQVFEVGEVDGRVFIAMELVRGQTLATWARREPRPTWREHVQAYAQVGAGLAAAHAAGLVHRDLKPSNCIMGDDGRVRVVDFGLAKGVGGDDEHDTLEGTPSHDVALTQHGVLLGTPAYMAPEQLAGRPGSPAADQFSLCVSLWEAVYGQRPFVGDTMPELTVHILEGRIAEPPAALPVPRWLRAILERGLALDPAQRWPSVAALVTALERGQARARRRRVTWGMVLALAMVAAGMGWRHYEQLARASACEAEGRAIEAAWNPDTAAALREAMLGTGLERAAVTVDKVLPWLDAHAEAWRSARADACMAASVLGTWSAEVYAKSQWCLDERRMELEALVAELRTGRVEALDQAVGAATELRRMEPCLDELGLARLPALPRGARHDVARVRAELSHAEALLATADAERALPVAEQALEQAQALAWPPLVAAARLSIAQVLHHQGKPMAAQAAYEDAFFEAMHADSLEIAAEAAGELTYVVGCIQLRPADGLIWSRHEQVVVERLSDAAGAWRADLLRHRGSVEKCQGELPAAKLAFEQAFALERGLRGPDHPASSLYLTKLADVSRELGELPQARRYAEQALALREQSLGPDHPDLVDLLSLLVSIHAESGEHDAAMAVARRAIDIQERTGNPDHPDVAMLTSNLGALNMTMGRPHAAKPLLERALGIYVRTFGGDHPQMAMTLSHLGLVHGAEGSHAQAKTLLERALRLQEASLGPEHPDVAALLINLGGVERSLGQPESARARLERALAIQERTLGPDHVDIGGTLVNLANLSLDAGDYARTEALLLRASASFERALGPDHQHVALCLTNLAEARHKAGRLESARATYEEAARVWERALGPEHARLAIPWMGLSAIALEEGEPAEAVERAEAALRRLEVADGSPTERVQARFLLGRALWAAGERARARTEVERAQAACEAIGGTGTCATQAMERWLEEHRARGGRAGRGSG